MSSSPYRGKHRERFFPRSVITDFSDQGERAFDEKCEAYKAHIEAISDKLPPGARKFAAYDFHDNLVVGISRPEKTVVRLDLDALGAWEAPARPRWTIQFVGVKKAWVPNDLAGQWWWIAETHLHEDGDVRVDIMFTNDEMLVVCEEILLTSAASPS